VAPVGLAAPARGEVVGTVLTHQAHLLKEHAGKAARVR